MRLPTRKRRVRIEMLPLLDVIFLVLVVMIYAMLTMTVQVSMPVRLPDTSNQQPTPEPLSTLSIDANGQIWLGKTQHTLASLPEALAQLDKSQPLQIAADGAIPYQQLYEVMDLAREAGLQKINLQASPR